MAAGRIIAAAVLFHAFFAIVHSANLGKRMRTHAGLARPAVNEEFDDPRENFNPPTMLIMSSPMERKVSYAQIKDFKAVGGTVLPILDAGLVGPYGLAWDAPRSALYICDGSLRKIFRVQLKAFKCKRQCKGIDYQLMVDGNQYTVVQDVIAQWASVDEEGNLFFTDQETNSVNRLPVESIDKIIKDELLAKELAKTSEPEAEGEEATKEAIEETENTTKTVVTTPQPPSIFELYKKDVSEHVGTPAGIVASGSQLYWTNQVGGFSSGSIAEGKTNPRLKKPAASGDDEGGDKDGSEEKPTFPSFKVANNTGSAYGIALTSSKIIYSDTSHYVWACSRGTGETVGLTHSLLKPRGIVWDGDNTVYVADQEGNYVSSMPVGLLKPNAPVSQVVDIHSPFGLALVKSTDPIWDSFQRKAQQSGSRRAASACSLMVLVSTAIVTTIGLPTLLA